MVAHSKESEIYRCNDPRQSGGGVFSRSGKENLRVPVDREREMCAENGDEGAGGGGVGEIEQEAAG